MGHLKMVDMRMTTEEKAEFMAPSPPNYPYGLCLSLCQDELEKLDLGDADIEVGDMMHLQVMARVTSVSESDHETSGPACRIELQITHIGSVEDEDTEFADEEEPQSVTSRLYR